MKTLERRVEQLEEKVSRSDEMLIRFGDPNAPGAKESIPPGFKGKVLWVQFVDPDEEEPRPSGRRPSSELQTYAVSSTPAAQSIGHGIIQRM